MLFDDFLLLGDVNIHLWDASICWWTPSSRWSLKKQGAFIRYRWDISPVSLTMVEIFGIFAKKFPIFRWVVTAGSSWSQFCHRLHLQFLFFVKPLVFPLQPVSCHRGSAEAIPVNAYIYIFCFLCSAYFFPIAAEVRIRRKGLDWTVQARIFKNNS